MSYSRHYRASPQFITAKFASTCAETGAAITKGDNILYDPNSKKAYCKTSQSYKDFQTAEFDRIYLGREY